MSAWLVYQVLRQILQMLTQLARDGGAKEVELLVLRHEVADLARDGRSAGGSVGVIRSSGGRSAAGATATTWPG